MKKLHKALALGCLAALVAPGAVQAEVVDRVGSVRLQAAPYGLNAGGAPDYAEGVQAVVGDASPTAGASLINNYLFQDEQINVLPTDGVVTVLRTDQKSAVQPFVTTVFEIKNVNPREILNVFQVACGKEGGRAEVLMDPDNGKKYIQVICPKFQIPFLEQTIRTMDKDWLEEYNDGAIEVYYKAKHRDVASVDAIAFDIGTPDQSVRAIDTRNNSIKYLDDPGSVKWYLWMAEQVDIPPHQVEFEGAIYEINENDDLKLGLDYVAWKNGPGRSLWTFIMGGFAADQEFFHFTGGFDPTTGAYIPSGDPSGIVINTRAHQRYFAANAVLTAAYLDFLQAKGKAKVMSKFSVTTKSGNPGIFERVDEVVSFEAADLISPFDDVADGNTTTDPGSSGSSAFTPYDGQQYDVPNRTLRYKHAGETGLFLSILPYIGTESMEVAVEMEVSDLNGLTPQGQPIINTRTLCSTVRLQDGQPIVLGGLTKKEKVKMHQGVPLLSDIPVLGYLFGGDTTVDRENKVIVVLTPKISLGSQDDLDIPIEVSTLMSQAEGEIHADLPSNSFGFDQWLLDSGD